MRPSTDHESPGLDPAGRRPKTPRQHSLTDFASMTLQCLYQHRLCSTGQLHRLLTPHARTTTYAKRQLAALRANGLIDAVAHRRAGEHLWFCTQPGADLVEDSGQVRRRAYRMDATRAAGPLQAHTLAVNETGLAFVEAARRLGHECGPLDWMPEVAHRLHDGPRGRFEDDYLIPDAVLNYLVEDARDHRRSQLQFFIEVDRATMTIARLATKIVQYARYYDYTPTPSPGAARAHGRPAWQYRYPRFPRLLIVLTNRTESALEQRAGDLSAHLAQLPYLRQRSRTDFTIGVTTLAQLQQPGPNADIVRPLLTSDTTTRNALA